MDAYLDIETTGLDTYEDKITVIGIGVARGRGLHFVQLYDDQLSQAHLEEPWRGDLTP